MYLSPTPSVASGLPQAPGHKHGVGVDLRGPVVVVELVRRDDAVLIICMYIYIYIYIYVHISI